jgi:hypothetical protein
MRPDKSDLILLAANFVWRGLPVDVVVAAGARPKKKALDWLMKFNSERRRCLIYQIDEEWFRAMSVLSPLREKRTCS